MTLRLNGSTSGYVEIDAPATAGSNTLVLPTGNGTNGQYLQTNGSGVLSWATVSTSNLTRSAVVTSTGVTSIDFTDMPAGVRRITIIGNQIRPSSSERPHIQIGTGGTPETTSYNGRSWYISTTTDITNYTYDTGFYLNFFPSNSSTLAFRMVLENVGGNTWVENHTGASAGWATSHLGAGSRTLSGALDIVRFRFSGSANIAANGGINCFYEV